MGVKGFPPRVFFFLIKKSGNKFKTFTPNVDNLNRRIIFKVFPKFGDIYIHTAGIKVAVIYPDSFQGEITIKDGVAVNAKVFEQFAFFCG